MLFLLQNINTRVRNNSKYNKKLVIDLIKNYKKSKTRSILHKLIYIRLF